MALKPKQQRFVQEYLIDQNGTRAAIRAGYTKHEKAAQVHASRLLSNAIIRAEIDKGLDEIGNKAAAKAVEFRITKEQWLTAVAEIGWATVTDFIGPDGQIKPAKDWTSSMGRAVKSLHIDSRGRINFQLYPKSQALELIAKHYGWIKDQIEHGGSIDIPVISNEQFQKVFGNTEAIGHARALAKITAAVVVKKGDEK